MALRETELNETHYLIFGPKGSHPCSHRIVPRAPRLAQGRWRPTRRF
jgi:hypothetical protein